MSLSLSLEGISKKIGRHWILKDISLATSQNELFAFVGPNGSGKTTLLKIVAGLIRPSQGRVCFNPHSNYPFCFLFDVPPFYEHLTIMENINLLSKTYSACKKLDKKKLYDSADILSIGPYLTKKVRHLSLGTRKKANMLLLYNLPYDIAFLDEPTNSLDPPTISILSQLLKTLKNEKLVIFSTHDLGFAQAICDRIGILYNGQLISTKALQDEREKYKNRFVLTLNGTSQRAIGWLEKNHLAEVIHQRDNQITIHPLIEVSSLLHELLNSQFNIGEFYQDKFQLFYTYNHEIVHFLKSHRNLGN